MKLEGYVIVPPINLWDNVEKVIPHMAYKTFGITSYESWSRHCGIEISHIDFQRIVQSWFDRGYRVKKASMDINYEK